MNNPMNKQTADERERQINDNILVGVSRILLAMLMGSMLLKLLVLRLPAEQCLTELVCLLAGGLYIVVRKKNAGMDFSTIVGTPRTRRKTNLFTALLLAVPEAVGTYHLVKGNLLYTALGIAADIAVTYLVLTLADIVWFKAFRRKKAKLDSAMDKDEDNLN